MASEFQRTCPQDRQTGSSIGYCIYDTLFLSLCQGFGGIFGEFNMFAKILPYFLPQLSEQHAAVFPTDGQDKSRYILRGNGVLCPFLFAVGECGHLFPILYDGENF